MLFFCFVEVVVVVSVVDGDVALLSSQFIVSALFPFSDCLRLTIQSIFIETGFPKTTFPPSFLFYFTIPGSDEMNPHLTLHLFYNPKPMSDARDGPRGHPRGDGATDHLGSQSR
jgi:hypothetical protein